MTVNEHVDFICDNAMISEPMPVNVSSMFLQAQYDSHNFSHVLSSVREDSSFKSSFGSTHVNNNSCWLFEEPRFISVSEFEAMAGLTLAKLLNTLTPEFP